MGQLPDDELVRAAQSGNVLHGMPLWIDGRMTSIGTFAASADATPTLAILHKRHLPLHFRGWTAYGNPQLLPVGCDGLGTTKRCC